MNSTKPFFFSEADDQFAPFVTKNKFKTDLALRILLEPQIIMSDVFFIISNKIEEDVARGEKSSWILHALSQGLIVPAFRSSSFDFVDVLNASRSKETIGIHDKARQTAEALNRSLRKSNETPKEWPPSLGIKFRENAEKILLTNTNLSGEDLAIWNRSRRYREGYLERSLAKESAEDGLRRSTYLREVAADWNFRGNAANWKNTLRRVPGEERDLVSAAIRWMNEVYNYTHAVEFSARPSFPITHGVGSQVIARKVFEPKTDVEEKSGTSSSRNYFFKATWPSAAALIRMPVTDLVGIRKDGNGKGYLDKLSEFRENPSDETAARVKEQLEQYSVELCSKIPGPRRNLVTIHEFRRPILIGGGITSAASAVGTPLAAPSPLMTGVFSALSATSAFATFYALIEGELVKRRKQQETQLEFQLRSSGEFQVDLSSDHLYK